MTLAQLLDSLKKNESFMQSVAAWQVLPAQQAKYAPFPLEIDATLQQAFAKKGVHSLYTHQREVFDRVKEGKDVVVVTPTASGKTLCYNLPVFHQIMKDPNTRALYLFPTKALSQDQVAEMYELIELMQVDIKTYTYDGDTPGNARKAVRQAGHIVVTNPDMLHSGILPHHTKWVKLFENLQYIVIDEIHSYRGVFGSNLANVLRRLLRICQFYGANPQFILCSATIDNPKELADTITGRNCYLIDQSGAPCGEKHILLYNPPVVNQQLGIRKSVLSQTRQIASALVKHGIQTIVFAKSRLQVEVLTRQLKEIVANSFGNSDSVRGYRGGYLPSLRRTVEKGLRAGEIKAVVSTNALELGVDIGALEACVLCGYPGTVASTWQQAGRAGRRQGVSLTILVASSGSMDQFIMRNPSYFFGQSPENALLNPDNLYIALNHLKCSAYELPFKEGESFANAQGTEEMLEYLMEQEILHKAGGTYHWMTQDFPASEISLRTAMTENFLIMDITDPKHIHMVGEMDRFTAPMLLHENAIYMHEGATYQVEKLDFDACKAFIRKVDVDYYTDADLNVSLSLLYVTKEKQNTTLGEIKITALVRMFKKMRFINNENVGFGPVMLPETDMHTVAVWWTVPNEAVLSYPKEDVQDGFLGITNLLRIVAPFYLMCSQRDIAVTYQVKCPFTEKPTLIMYDNCPGGIGLSEKAYMMEDILFQRALEIVNQCPCENGCPSCVGPVGKAGQSAKRMAKVLLTEVLIKGHL